MGGTCVIVRGCVFVPVGDGPVILFSIKHINFSIKPSTLVSLLCCCFPVFLYRDADPQDS